MRLSALVLPIGKLHIATSLEKNAMPVACGASMFLAYGQAALCLCLDNFLLELVPSCDNRKV